MADDRGTVRANPWVRLYRQSLHDPKIVSLTDRQHRAWHNCLIICDDDGYLPSLRDIGVHLRVCIPDAEQLLGDLIEARLVDVEVDGANRRYRMHDWSRWQYRSDSSTPRVRKHREKKACNGDETSMKRFSNDDVTPPDFRLQTSESEEESNTVPSEQEAACAKEQFKKSDFKRGRRKGEVKANLRALADGLGFDSVDWVRRAADANSPNAYFAELFRNELRTRFPHKPPDFPDRVVAGEQGALVEVYQMMLEAT